MVCDSDSSEWKTLKQLLQAAKDAPVTIKFGANLGALSHFGALQLEQAFSGAAFRYVPAGGGAKRFGDLIGDHIDVSVFNVGEYVNFKDGGLRALAILSNERDPAFPDVPTAREQGIDAVRDSMQYWWAPKKTSPDRVAYLVNLLREVMLSEAMQAKLAEMHVEPVFVTGPELRHTLRKRELVMQGVQMKSTIPMPNTPLMAIVVTVLLGGLTAFRRRTATAILPANASPIDGPAGEQNERQTGTLFSRSPVIALAALLAFCLLFSLEVLPFWLLSGTFVVGLGLLLMPRNAKTMATLFAIAVVVGPGCYLLFTKVLTIDLP